MKDIFPLPFEFLLWRRRAVLVKRQVVLVRDHMMHYTADPRSYDGAMWMLDGGAPAQPTRIDDDLGVDATAAAAVTVSICIIYWALARHLHGVPCRVGAGQRLTEVAWLEVLVVAGAVVVVVVSRSGTSSRV